MVVVQSLLNRLLNTEMANYGLLSAKNHGKGLKNTVSDCYSQEQNFVTMVSAFSHYRGEILGIKVMENKKQSEIAVVRDLLELLDLKGVVFTMDALHCQKSGCDPAPPTKVRSG